MKINFFGCSFTEGGGLDNFDYYNYLTGKNLNIDEGKRDDFEEIREFKEAHRYSSIVGNILNVDVENYAIGCNSNEGILKKVFEVVSEETTKKEDIFIIQTSFFSRKFYWYEPTSEFLSVNAMQKSDWPYRDKDIWMPLHQLHNLNLQYAHNEEYELSKLLMNIQIFNSYFKEKGIKIFWTPWPDLTLEPYPTIIDEINKELLKTIPNIIFYDWMGMGRYIEQNKLQIRDVYPIVQDSHKSLQGHELVGIKIANYLNNNI